MKNYLILLFSLLSFGLFAQSSDGFSDLDTQVKKLSQAYQLDQEQEEKLKLMLVDKSLSMEQFSDLKANDKVKTTKRFQVNESFHNALNAMTTDAQKEHYKKYIMAQTAKAVNKDKNSKVMDSNKSTGIKKN